MNKRTIITGSGILILLIAIISSMVLIANKPVPPKDEKRESYLNVRAEKVAYQELSTKFVYQGRVSAQDNVSLAAEVSGRILQGEIPFKEGQSFKKGELLIRIFDADAAAGLKASKSQFLRSISLILPDLKVDFPQRFSAWETFFNAIDIEKSLPEIPKAQSEKEQIFLASNGLLADYYSLKQKEINLSKYQIHAPFDGYFKTVNREVGSIAGIGTELAVIIRSDVLEIVVPVFPVDAARIAARQEVSIASKSGANYSGTISRIAQFVDEATQSVNVYVAYKPQGQRALLEGEFVSVNFQIDQPIYGMKIPREAIMEKENVFLIRENKLHKAKAKILQELDDKVVINGIPEGEIVVTESLVGAKEGMLVRAR